MLEPVWQATLGGVIGGALAAGMVAYQAVTAGEYPWRDSWPKYVIQVFLTLALGAGAGWLIIGEIAPWAGGCIVGLTGPYTIRQIMKGFGNR
jgi:putative copper export protein